MAPCKQLIFKPILVAILTLIILLGIDFPGFAATLSEASKTVDRASLEPFIDQIFTKAQQEMPMPGAVFVLVKNGKVVLSKGYGYANLEQRARVDPNKTLFRLGSISKIITTTAVMQLVEQGKLQLHQSIQSYLPDWSIDQPDRQSLTLEQLLTHTDGYDVAWTIGASRRCETKAAFGEWLQQHLPDRVRQPGELYVYGDVGIALAGYLVEVQSGMAFDQVIQQRIFDPLSMQQSTFAQPLPPSLSRQLATGYRFQDATYQTVPFTCGNSAPTVGMSTTAQDMAKFMIEQLQPKRILQASTLDEMQRSHFRNFPPQYKASGAALGWYERYQNNQRAIEHGGSLNGYASQLFLIPEQNLGFFVAFNHEDTGNFRETLITQFLDRYYPKLPVRAAKLSETDHKSRLQQIEGWYRFVRYPQQSIAKFWAVWFGPRPDVQLKLNQDQTITFLPRGTRWQEIEPWLLKYQDDNNYLIFRQTNGKVTSMSLSNYVFVTYEKLAWYDSLKLHRALFILCAIVFIVAGYVFPIYRFLVRSQCDSHYPTRSVRWVQQSTSLIAGLNGLFLVGMLFAVWQTNQWDFFDGMPKTIVALLYVPIVTTGLTTCLPLLGVLAWRDKTWSRLERSLSGLLLLASCGFISLLIYWNFLGFRF